MFRKWLIKNLSSRTGFILLVSFTWFTFASFRSFKFAFTLFTTFTSFTTWPFTTHINKSLNPPTVGLFGGFLGLERGRFDSLALLSPDVVRTYTTIKKFQKHTRLF